MGAAANFVLYSCPTLTLVCVPSGSQAGFSLIDAARITGVHPEMIRYYWRLGLLDAQLDRLSGMPTFDREALEEIRRIEHYRRNLGVSRRALPLVCQLRQKCERLQIELSFLRSP
jgi:DNA-binding transcriptional MerR regulator